MSRVSKKIVESSSFNLLGVYLSFGLGILNTFLIARLLVPDNWAIIILTINLIYLCVFICNLFPPNAQDSIKYYIPHITSKDLNENHVRKRSFIFHVYKIRTLSAGFITILYFIIAILANFKEEIFQIIVIMSPIVFFDILKNLNTSVLLAFQKFKKVFVINIIYPSTVLIGFLTVYVFGYRDPLVLVAYIYLSGSILSCILSIILIIPIIPFRKLNMRISPNYKEDFIAIHKKYGAYLTLADVFTQLTFLIIYLLFVNSEPLYFITWLTIFEISVMSALLFSSSDPNAYISIFSEINFQKDRETYSTNFYQLNKFIMLFVCIIVGIMIFFIEIYITVIYSETYLILIFFLQIYLFTAFSRIIVRNLFIITQSTNNTRINATVSFIQMIIFITASVFALIFYSFRALILLFLVGSFLMPFIAVYLVNKKMNMNLKLIIFFKPFLVFLAAFLITLPLNYFIHFPFITNIYLLKVFLNNLIKFFIFTLVFYILFYFTRVLTKEEFSNLVEILPVLHSNNKITQKIVKFLIKILPSEKKKPNYTTKIN
ncbi:MAG: lipopolysaccharide biosynthesis protein [Promethearchaeota archaeon]